MKTKTETAESKRVTIYAWADGLGDAARKVLAAMPAEFRDEASARLRAYSAAKERCERLSDVIEKAQARKGEAEAELAVAEQRLSAVEARIKGVMDAATLPFEGGAK